MKMQYRVFTVNEAKVIKWVRWSREHGVPTAHFVDEPKAATMLTTWDAASHLVRDVHIMYSYFPVVAVEVFKP